MKKATPALYSITLKNSLKKWTQKQRKILKSNDIDISEKKRILKDNVILFGEFYIKPYTKNWNTKTANHHYLLLENILLNKNSVTHVPVEHAKSTWITLVLVLWFIVQDLNTQGAIISSTARQAEGFLGVIKWHIEHNERLHRDFPELKQGKKWTEKSIFVERSRTNQSKDATVTALGIGGEILGARLDWVILDDALSLNNSTTKTWRDKLEKWFNQMVDGRVVEKGRRILVGTLQHNEDLLCIKSLKHYEIQQGIRKCKLEKNDFHYLHMSAVNEETKETLWADRWSYERIQETIKRIGTIAYLKTLQNDRSAKIGKLFNADWLHFWKKLPQFNFNVVIGFDPSLSKQGQAIEDRDGDECGLCVMLDDWENNKVYLVEEYAERLDFNEQLKVLKHFYYKVKQRFDKPVTIAIENVYYQDALKQKLFADGLPAVGVGVHKDKVTRMEFLSADIETGRALINEEHLLFINEFTDFESNYTKSPNVMDAFNTGLCYIKNRKEVSEEDLNFMQEISFM